MKTNQGLTERMLRMYLGMIIAGSGIFYNSIWALAGIPVFVSGIVGICPIYSILNFSSVTKKELEQE